MKNLKTTLFVFMAAFLLAGLFACAPAPTPAPVATEVPIPLPLSQRLPRSIPNGH